MFIKYKRKFGQKKAGFGLVGFYCFDCGARFRRHKSLVKHHQDFRFSSCVVDFNSETISELLGKLS